MFGNTSDSLSTAQIKLVRKYLKLKILEDNVTFRRHDQERSHVYDLFKRTIFHGESHSALVIGPRGCGKTTLINSVLNQLSKEGDISSDAIIVKLNGLIHQDEKIALKSITAQMQLENAVGDRVFGTFAENLAYLLTCLQSGSDRRCKSMVFILEEFDMFCHSGRTQTLLYNLFDITHSKESPMCVLGITNRLDVIELLEKRVKSRFSHRHIFIFPHDVPEGAQSDPVGDYRELFVQLLTLPERSGKKKKRNKSVSISEPDTSELPAEVLTRCDSQHISIDSTFAQEWNEHIRSVVRDERVVDCIEKFCYYLVNEQVFRNVLFQLVSNLSPSKPYIDITDLLATIDATVAPEHRISQLQSLSILEFSLLIAMLHGTEIFDGNPMNFEMVLHRYTKFANSNATSQTVPRPVILKAFEHLQELELLIPARGDAGGLQKEFRLLHPAVGRDLLQQAARGLPTDVHSWLQDACVGEQ